MRSSLSVYSRTSPGPESLRTSLERLTVLAGRSRGASGQQPDWLLSEFGERATQERLRAGLAQAAAARIE